ncbi:hypothetical protein BH09DEP1_BH09DEP1_6940 [soil metagenome]
MKKLIVICAFMIAVMNLDAMDTSCASLISKIVETTGEQLFFKCKVDNLLIFPDITLYQFCLSANQTDLLMTDEAILGTALVIYKKNTASYELEDFKINKNVRSKGYGSLFLKEIGTYLRSIGAQEISGWAVPLEDISIKTKERLYAFYQRNGATEVATKNGRFIMNLKDNNI